jgi:hypothetical protein
VTESTRGAGENRVISRDDDDTVGQIADLFSVPRTTIYLPFALRPVAGREDVSTV